MSTQSGQRQVLEWWTGFTKVDQGSGNLFAPCFVVDIVCKLLQALKVGKGLAMERLIGHMQGRVTKSRYALCVSYAWRKASENLVGRVEQ